MSSISKASGKVSESSKELSKSAEAKWKARRQSCGPVIVQVKEKLRKLPQYHEFKEENLEEVAADLTDPKSLRIFFSHLIEHPVDDAVSEALGDELEASFTQQEAAMATERDQIRIGQSKDLPVRLYLRYIQLYHNKPQLACNLASLVGADHGAMHAALKVGDVLLEWSTSCLVIPRYEYECNFIFEVDVHDGDSLRQIQQMSIKDSNLPPDKGEVVEHIFEIAAAKTEIIDALIAVIVDYNSKRYYNPLSRNCQTFVKAAMKALGIKNGPKLEGKMHEHYEKLKAGKSKETPDSFAEHIDLDSYIMTLIEKDRQLGNVLLSDLQYLACIYHQFHLVQKAKSSVVGSEEWKCEEQTCKLATLVSTIDARRLFSLSK